MNENVKRLEQACEIAMVHLAKHGHELARLWLKEAPTPQWFGPTKSGDFIRLDSPTSGEFFSRIQNLGEPAEQFTIAKCLNGTYPRTTHAAAAAANKVVARECPVAERVDDIATLKSRLAEVERENDSLKAVRDTYSLEIRNLAAERNRLRAELEKAKPTPFIAPGEDISKYPEGVERAWKLVAGYDTGFRWFLINGKVVCGLHPFDALSGAISTLVQLKGGINNAGDPVTLVYDRKGKKS